MDQLLQRVQVRFLRELYRGAKSGFVLKGGLALATLYGRSRATREVDLDFPAARTAESLHGQVGRALRQALRGSHVADVRIHEPGKAELSPRWKINGLGPAGEAFSMRIEVSRRPPPPGRVRQAVVSGGASYGVGTFYVDLYEEGTLAAMKLAALLGRSAVRDVYDLDLLLPAHAPGLKLIQWALEHAHIDAADAARAVVDRLVALDWNLFRSQMLIDPELLGRIDAAAWEAMKARVRDVLAPLLDEQARALGGES